MTRATRFAAYTAPVVIFYLLAMLGVVNIPFMSEASSDALVPVVSQNTMNTTLRLFVDLITSHLVSCHSGCWSHSEHTPWAR